MKKILNAFALIIIAACLVFGQSSLKAKKSDKSSAEREVLGVIDKLAEAGLKRDVATIDRLYSNDYFHTNPDGSIMTKEQVITAYKSKPAATIESNRHDEARVRIYQNTALVNSQVTLKGKANNQPFVRLYRVTYVLRKTRGQWQIVMSHASLILQ